MRNLEQGDGAATTGGIALRPPSPTGLVVAALVLTFSSSFGQTFFISLFAPWLKRDLGIGDGLFGGFYTLGTLASAATLMVVGKLADRFRIRFLAVGVMASLAAVCLVMAFIPAAWVLLPVFFGLRLFGQGFSGHLAITGVGRWYLRRRGKMMSIAVLGFPAGEAVMPFTVVSLAALIGWRETWAVGAAALVFVSIPLILWFLRNEPAHDAPPEPGGEGRAGQRQWTRAEVLRLPPFFVAMMGVVAPSFVMTGVFFHQAALVEAKGWSLAWYAGWFPVFAAVSVLAMLTTGWLVDRFGARLLLPVMLLPMAAGVTVLALAEDRAMVPVFMGLAALTSGSSSTLLGALWAELFGTRHLGSIRSVVFAAQVFASALAPGLIGVLLDRGIAVETQFLGMVGYTLAAAAALAAVTPRLARIADG